MKQRIVHLIDGTHCIFSAIELNDAEGGAHSEDTPPMRSARQERSGHQVDPAAQLHATDAHPFDRPVVCEMSSTRQLTCIPR